MNNKGQFGFIKILFFAGLFIILFSLALAPFVSSVLGSVDLTGAYGSFGGWIVGSLNIWFILAFVILIFSALIWGFTSE